SAKKNLGELRWPFASVLHWRRIRGWRICSSARFLVASLNTIDRSFARFKSPAVKNTRAPNSRRIRFLTSGRSRSSSAASSASKRIESGTSLRRHATNALLPVEIPPVIPIAGMIEERRANEAHSFALSEMRVSCRIYDARSFGRKDWPCVWRGEQAKHRLGDRKSVGGGRCSPDLQLSGRTVKGKCGGIGRRVRRSNAAVPMRCFQGR